MLRTTLRPAVRSLAAKSPFAMGAIAARKTTLMAKKTVQTVRTIASSSKAVRQPVTAKQQEEKQEKEEAKSGRRWAGASGIAATGGVLAWTVFSRKEESKDKDAAHGPTPARGKGIKIFSGNAHPALAKEICDLLDVPMGKAEVSRFANGETNVVIQESVRDCDVYVIQPTCNPSPNEALMELVIMLDAFRRAGALRVTAVLPIFGYARQDKKDSSRAPITAKVVADMIHHAGADRIISVDLHAPQIQGFTNKPIDNLYGLPLIVKEIREHVMDSKAPTDDLVVVSPDVGGAKRADQVASSLGAGMAIFSKKRKKANEVSSMILVGDVQGKICVLVDDMCDTGGSLTLGAQQLIKEGAREVHAAVVHGVFSRDALDKINASPIKTMIVTDTIPMAENEKKCDKLRVLNVAPLLAESIMRVHKGDSLSELFSANSAQLLKPPKVEHPLPGAAAAASKDGKPAAAAVAPAAAAAPAKDAGKDKAAAPAKKA